MIKGIDLKFIAASPASVDHPHQIKIRQLVMMAQKEAHFSPQVRQSTAERCCTSMNAGAADSLSDSTSRTNRTSIASRAAVLSSSLKTTWRAATSKARTTR
jgi:hypothetical protein